jgi:hypothetical protein
MPPTFTPELAHDLFCVSCGYNLRGLDEGALCPECGAPAARSLDRRYFRDADPQWVRRVGFALQLLPLTGVAWFAAVVLAAVFLPSFQVGRTYWRDPLLIAIPFGPRPLGLAATLCTDTTLDHAQAAVLFLPIAFYLATVWRLTTPHGAPAPGAGALLSTRQLLRFAVLLYGGSVLVFAYVVFSYHTSIVTAEIRAVSLGFLAVDVILIPLLYRHLTSLAWWIPNPSLARRARLLMFAWLVIDLALTGPQLATIAFRYVPFEYTDGLLRISVLVALLAVPLTFLFNTHFASLWHTASRARRFWSRARRSASSYI